MKAKSLAIISIALVASVSNAALVIFSGVDAGANSSDPRPNSNAAAAAFDAAAGGLGSMSLIDFESAPVGNFVTLTIGGVTLGSNQEIRNTPFSTPDSLWGYNTTAGGINFLGIFGGQITFTFATPIQSFGAYIGGVQAGPESMSFNDGAPQSISLVNVGSGMQFLGFTDAGASITSITIDAQFSVNSGDIISMDDVRYGAVPEPASFAVLGFGALALLRRRRK